MQPANDNTEIEVFADEFKADFNFLKSEKEVYKKMAVKTREYIVTILQNNNIIGATRKDIEDIIRIFKKPDFTELHVEKMDKEKILNSYTSALVMKGFMGRNIRVRFNDDQLIFDLQNDEIQSV